MLLALPQLRIVGGNTMNGNSTPWIAALYRGLTLDCGGTLIHPHWVLVCQWYSAIRLTAVVAPTSPYVDKCIQMRTYIFVIPLQTAAHCVENGAPRIEGMSDTIGERFVFVGGYDRTNMSSFEAHMVGTC